VISSESSTRIGPEAMCSAAGSVTSLSTCCPVCMVQHQSSPFFFSCCFVLQLPRVSRQPTDPLQDQEQLNHAACARPSRLSAQSSPLTPLPRVSQFASICHIMLVWFPQYTFVSSCSPGTVPFLRRCSTYTSRLEMTTRPVKFEYDQRLQVARDSRTRTRHLAASLI
jgi:hypothetical protein